MNKNYKKPPVELFSYNENKKSDTQEYQNKIAKKIVEFYEAFNIKLIFIDVIEGSIASSYQFKIAMGSRICKIESLEEDLAFALNKPNVRFVLTNNKATFEVPNEYENSVYFREILDTKRWEESKDNLPIILGKTFGNEPIIKDLTKMPHILIAGATGRGNTECMYSIIVSLIYKNSPEDLRFLMIDTKVVDLNSFNDLPHMLTPVINDPCKATNALEWLIEEMKMRYNLFELSKTLNIKNYNEKLINENKNAKKLPYIVCVINDLSDLMIILEEQFEILITRLSQLARAAGIHLIIVSERPKCEIITDLIKTALPTKIAFKTPSKIYSKAILDSSGSEKLLGRGDMLISESGNLNLIRAQCPYIPDGDIKKLLEFMSKESTPSYDKNLEEILNEQK